MVLVSEGDKQLSELITKYKSSIKLGVSGTLALYVVYRLIRWWQWRKWVERTYGPILVSGSTWWGGNLPQIIAAGGFTDELFYSAHKEKGPLVALLLGPTILNFAVASPELIAETYIKCPDRPLETYNFLWYLGKENLMFARGEMVKNLRLRYGKMISDRSQLEKAHEKTIAEFNNSVQRWGSNQSVDLFRSLGPSIYDIMGQVMFNQKWLESERGAEIYRLHKYLIENTNTWILFPSPGPLFHPGYLKYIYVIYSWRKQVAALLDERAAQIRADPKKWENDGSALTLILTSKNADGTPFFSRARAISTICGFLNGAYDTTHCTAFWIHYHLAKYPECQDKLLAEFAQVLGNKKVPDLDDLRKCDYLHAFIQESIRFKATVPVNQRMNFSEDVTIGNYNIPKGVNINVPYYTLHFNEDYFGPNVHEFRPERFLGESPEAIRNRKNWVPFGANMRMCIGFTFALAELKAMIHTVVTQRIVKLENPNEPGLHMLEAGVNQPKNKFNFVFEKRVDGQKVAEESNLRWWLQQEAAFEKAKAAAGVSGQVA